ncbi:coiled-coil domain-containing protein 33-like isoform X1 [Haliotis cracherodii]|uniref:coiled-coil domain-containing protein 33-like isoform X1 n=1 Tax=Haliotis cracherodii TaxID=6455 RepID=UPI0039E9EB56
MATIEQKKLTFDVEIHDAQFNHMGKYFLKLRIQSLHTHNFSQIRIKKPPYDDYAYDNEGLTDVVQQTADAELCTFHDRFFSFKLPKGFCKNDKNHDVYLLIEAFSLPEKDNDMGKKVGEGKFAIYPRTNAPRINLNVKTGQDMYNYTDIVSLLRTVKTDNIQMHCGRLRCTFALKESVTTPKREDRRPSPEPTPTPRPTPRPQPVVRPSPRPVKVETPPPPPPRRASPVSSWGDNLSLNITLPASPPPPPLSDGRQMAESPLPNRDQSTFSMGPGWRHVSQTGKEQIDVILHGASSVPPTNKGNRPVPYVSIKTKSEDDRHVRGQGRTHATIRPTSAPTWEERLSLELDENKAPDETMVLTVGDSVSKQTLVNYKIPVGHLQPFHQYHMEMVVPSKDSPSGVRMYASVMRKLSKLPKEMSSPNYHGLEVYLRSVQRSLQNPPGPLVAVARIVPDYYNYKADNLMSNPRTAGVSMTSVTFPSPHPSSFSVVPRSKHGYPQVSLPGHPEKQPTWNQPYLFSAEKDKATMFTPSAALVIEYYVADTTMNDDYWKIQSPIGFSSLLLDQQMYTHLTADRAKNGLRIEGLPIQGTDMLTEDGRAPTVGLILKLITTDHPDSMGSYSNINTLPEIDLHPTETMTYYRHSPDELKLDLPESPDNMDDEEEEEERGPNGEWVLRRKPLKSILPIRDGELPPYEAMETILPEYEYIFKEGETTEKTSRTYRKDPQSNRTQHHTQRTTVTVGPSRRNDYDPSVMVIDAQMRETDNYRTAVTRMGHDIVTLRNTVRSLENENSQLRGRGYNDATALIIDSTETESLSKTDLASRYASLREKFVSQMATVKSYKDKVQRLQNELIKKNDREKEYLRMSQAHSGQQELLQRLQEKILKLQKLEETVRKQERVIEKLERIIYKLKNSKGEGVSGDFNSAMAEENRRLRQQIIDLQEQLKNSGRGGDDLEKLELYQALERAEARIMALEKQLSENSRNWGRERADISIRLNEAEHGLGRNATMASHEYPTLDELRLQRTLRLEPLLR